jgi:shikimate kinase
MYTKIVLVGYMASGKSTVGQNLADLTSFEHIDLDQCIEENEQMSIKSIFSTKGEMYFRKVEALTFKQLLLSDQALIISTGGGTPCYANSHLLLQNKDVFSVYLKASVSTIENRLTQDSINRPLLHNLDGVTLQEYIAKHLFDRAYYYHSAKFSILVDDKSVSQIANEILNRFNSK